MGSEWQLVGTESEKPAGKSGWELVGTEEARASSDRAIDAAAAPPKSPFRHAEPATAALDIGAPPQKAPSIAEGLTPAEPKYTLKPKTPAPAQPTIEEKNAELYGEHQLEPEAQHATLAPGSAMPKIRPEEISAVPNPLPGVDDTEDLYVGKDKAEVTREMEAAGLAGMVHPKEAIGNMIIPGAGTAVAGAKEAIAGPDAEEAAAHGINRTTGVLRAASGAMELPSAMIPIGLAEAPVASAVGLGAGVVGGYGAGRAAEALGADPQQKELAEQVGFFLPSIIGAGVGLRGRVAEGPGDSKIAAADVLGGKAAVGVAKTPSEYSAGVKFGDQRYSVSVPRSGAPSALEGQVEPTSAAESEATKQADEAIGALVRRSAAEKMAGAVVSGVAPPPGAPTAPQPQQQAPASPIASGHVKPELIHGIAEAIQKLPPEQQPQAVLEAHQKMAEALLQQGRVVGPDGKLHIIENEKQAAKLAQSWLNEKVDELDKSAAAGKIAKEGVESRAGQPEPSPSSPAAGGWELVGAEPDKTIGSKQEPVVEESRATVDAQMDALKRGDIDVVFVPAGASYRPEVPDGMKMISVDSKHPGAGVYIYDQQQISGATIRDAAKAGTHGQLLGHLQSKAEIQQAQGSVVVQAKAKDGTPIQDSEVSKPELVQQQAEILQARHPGATIEVRPTDEVIAERAAANSATEPYNKDAGEKKGFEKGQRVVFTDRDGNERTGVIKHINELAVRLEGEHGAKYEIAPSRIKNAAPAAHDDERVRQALAKADLIDIDERNSRAGGRQLDRMEHPEKGALINFEVRGAEGLTLSAYAKDLDTPEKAAKVAAAKLREKGQPVPESLARRAGVAADNIPAPGHVGEAHRGEIEAAPHAFQYKMDTDAAGVTQVLKDAATFNPEFAGTLSVYRAKPIDERDGLTPGKTYVANGHHRLELANRTEFDGKLAVRHLVAADAREARAKAALQNISEGRGTAIDAAKYFRDTGATIEVLRKEGLSLGEATVAKGFALSKLSDKLFNAVVQKDMPIERAAAIGEATSDHAEQQAIADLIAAKEKKGQRVTNETLRELIRFAKSSGQTTETTASLFGEEQVSRSLALEKAEVSAYIREQLAKDKRLFGFVAKGERAERLAAEQAGQIDVGKAGKISADAAQAEAVYNKLSERAGPVATVLDRAAQRLADGENPNVVKQEAYRDARAGVAEALGGGAAVPATHPRAGEGARAGSQGDDGQGGTAPAGPEGKGPLDLLRPSGPQPVFYSKALQVAEAKLPNSGLGLAMLRTLENNGVKPDEIKWMGLDDFLKGKGKVTKAEVQDFIRENSLQVDEVVLGGKDGLQKSLDGAYNRFYEVAQHELGIQANTIADRIVEGGSAYILIRDHLGHPPSDELALAGRDLFNAAAATHSPSGAGGGTKFQKYQTPGGENYRELLLTLPHDAPALVHPEPLTALPEGYDVIQDESQPVGRQYGIAPPGQIHAAPLGLRRYASAAEAKAGELNIINEERNEVAAAAWRKANESKEFRGGHFSSVSPNVLAHVRFNDRLDATGKKLLFLEELQSDWHQKGRREGYQVGAEQAFEKLKAEVEARHRKNLQQIRFQKERTAQEDADLQAIDKAYSAAMSEKHGHAVPDAPFKNTWHELALKRMLRWAAENGYEKLGWTTGEMQAERYDLSRQISALHYQKTGAGYSLYTSGGAGGVDSAMRPLASGISEPKLSDYVGKEVAEKIINGEGKNSPGDVQTLSGVDLKVGGHGMKGFYDKIIPDFLNKYGKKWGAKVGGTEVSKHDPDTSYHVERSTQGEYFVVRGGQQVAGPFATRPNDSVWKTKEVDTARVHSVDITPEMKKSVIEEGQPLFKGDGLIRGRSEQAENAIVRNMSYSVHRPEGLAPYLLVNRSAMMVLNKAYNAAVGRGSFAGTSLDPEHANDIAAQLDTFAGVATDPDVRDALTSLAKTVRDGGTVANGLTVVPAAADGGPDPATLLEELIHSSIQRPVGIPADKLISHPVVQKMEPIIRAEYEAAGFTGLSDVQIVAEAFVDVVAGERERFGLSPEEEQQFIADYKAATLEKSGTDIGPMVEKIVALAGERAAELAKITGTEVPHAPDSSFRRPATRVQPAKTGRGGEDVPGEPNDGSLSRPAQVTGEDGAALRDRGGLEEAGRNPRANEGPAAARLERIAELETEERQLRKERADAIVARKLALSQRIEADRKAVVAELTRLRREASGKPPAKVLNFPSKAPAEPQAAPVASPSERITDTPQFKKWFGDSKVVDGEGTPLVVYHGTTQPGLERFTRRGGMAGNFGSADQANRRLGHRADDEAMANGFTQRGERVFMDDDNAKLDNSYGIIEHSNLVPAYLSIKNPLRMSDVHFDEATTMLNDLVERKVISKNESKELRGPFSFSDGQRQESAKLRRIVEALKQKGYDGIVYANQIEGRGDDTWIPFDPKQVKSAIANSGAFSPKESDILASPARRGELEWGGSGLSDEQIEAWGKAKSLRIEEAGEQGGLFGAGEPMYRMTREDADGQPEKALVPAGRLQQLADNGSKNVLRALREARIELPEQRARREQSQDDAYQRDLQQQLEARKLVKQQDLFKPLPPEAVTKLYDEDVKPAIEKAGVTLKGVGSLFVEAFFPRAEESSFAARALGVAAPRATVDAAMTMKGDRDQLLAQYDLASRGIEKMFDHMPQADRIAFIDRIMQGKQQPTAELRAISTELMKSLDGLRAQEKQWRALTDRENYFPLRWKVIPGSGGVAKRGGTSGGAALQGNRSFAKEKTIPDASTGIKRGGRLETTNPVRLLRMRLEEGVKFVSANRLWEQLGKLGLRQQIGAKEPTPEGYDDIPDSIAQVYFPAKSGEGMIHGGRWVVEANSARLLKNYLSRDLIRTGKFGVVGRPLMFLKNASTALELALSPFHAVFETVEANSSQMALGMLKLYNQGIRQGNLKAFASGIKDIGTSPVAFIQWARDGAALPAYIGQRERLHALGIDIRAKQIQGKLGGAARNALHDFVEMRREKNVERLMKKYPDLDHMVDMMFAGGINIGQHRDYQVKTLQTFMENWTGGNPLGAVMRAIPNALQVVMKPLFEWYIPNLKYAMFMKQFSQQRAERAADLESGVLTEPELARKVVDSIENRFGELNFENLFWDRTLKTALQFAFRSVTWKLGNVREFSGAALGQSKELAEWLHLLHQYNPTTVGMPLMGGEPGEQPALPPKQPGGESKKTAGEKALPRLDMKASWFLSLMVTTALLGTVASKLLSGKYPWEWAQESSESWQDYVANMYKETVHFRTGETDFRGKPSRGSLPTYWKDVEHFSKDPGRTVIGSLSTTLSKAIDVAQNRDWQGNYVYNPTGSFAERQRQKAGYMLPAPFIQNNFQKAAEQGEDKTAWLSAFGFVPASSDTDLSAAEQRIVAYQREHHQPYTPDEIEEYKERRRKLESGEASPKEVAAALRDAETPWALKQFKKLSYYEALDVYHNYANEEEKAMMEPILKQKRSRAFKADPDKVQAAEEKAEE